MAKSIKLKEETYLDGNSVNVGFKRQDLKLYLNNREPHYFYTSDGRATWYKVLHLKNTVSWGSACIFFTIQTFNESNPVALCSIQYYNNNAIGGRILSGNISASNVQYKKNNDNTLDVFVYIDKWYSPLLICPIYVYSMNSTEWDIWEGTGYVDSLSGGTSFTKI